MSEHYDYVIAGAGLAGRSLAYFLSRDERTSRRRILLIESPDEYPHRTLSYWTDGEPPLGLASGAAYRRLRISTGSTEETYDLRKYAVRVTSSREVFAAMDPHLQGNDSLVWVTGRVGSVRGGRRSAKVTLEDGRRFTADYVFDSTFSPEGLRPKLMMHGEGWHIAAPSPVFDVDTATLFDFRTSSKDAVRFFYVLPRSASEALVEVTHLSPRAAPAGIDYAKELTDYLEQVWHLHDFRVAATEGGTIPLALRPPRPVGRVIPIGTRSGIVKATTGFGFTRILDQSRQLSESLAAGRSPAYTRSALRFRAYDKPVIGMWRHRPSKAAGFMASTFAANDADTVLRFLSERTTLTEERAIAGTMPVRELLDPAIWR